jgi:hypothetical protein
LATWREGLKDHHHHMCPADHAVLRGFGESRMAAIDQINHLLIAYSLRNNW